MHALASCLVCRPPVIVKYIKLYLHHPLGNSTLERHNPNLCRTLLKEPARYGLTICFASVEKQLSNSAVIGLGDRQIVTTMKTSLSVVRDQESKTAKTSALMGITPSILCVSCVTAHALCVKAMQPIAENVLMDTIRMKRLV